MVHLHYSPFQFSNEVRASDNAVLPAKKIASKLNSMVKTPVKSALMSRDEAHKVLSLTSPTAFISPNTPDVMRTIKAVFGN
jgi:hypothetical protein